MQLPIRVAREGGFEPRKRSGLDAKIMSAKPRLVWHRPTERSIHLPSGARIEMSKERPPACKNLRSFQTAEKGDLRANLSLGASFRGDMSPRSEARTCPHNSISPARRPAEKFLIKPTRAERDV